MRFRNLLLASVLVLGVVAMTAGTAGAVLVGIQIEVFKNGVSQGTAFGGASTSTDTPFIVNAVVGDTLRFVVQLESSFTVTAWGTSIVGVHDPVEIDFINGSASILSGWTFAAGAANPNSSLNDGTPTIGGGVNNAVASTGQNLYRVDYLVKSGVVTDALRDFNVVLTGFSNATGDLLNATKDSASVRVDVGVPEVIPEPASLLLLGSGLAGLVGFGRKKFRR